MKIAVLSDVHGNVPALEAVLDDVERWTPDEVIVNGDLINRGPYSLACLRLIQARLPKVRLLRGNHEMFVIDSADQAPDTELQTFDLFRFGYWTAAQLGGAVEDVRTWPDHLDLTDLEGGSFHITHGSRLGNRSGIHPETSDEELPAKLGDPRDLFIASHTHMPMLRRFNGTLVVNTGSVGQPFDGDPRGAYGRFSFHSGRWDAEIVRIDFDRQRALRDFDESGFLAEAGPLAQIVYRELERAEMHLARWMARYLQAVKGGEITVADAAREYLDSL